MITTWNHVKDGQVPPTSFEESMANDDAHGCRNHNKCHEMTMMSQAPVSSNNQSARMAND
jgi:hypothetical protein